LPLAVKLAGTFTVAVALAGQVTVGLLTTTPTPSERVARPSPALASFTVSATV
jgi:hypothetical protein